MSESSAILHVIVVGFHHKKGCQVTLLVLSYKTCGRLPGSDGPVVEYCYPALKNGNKKQKDGSKKKELELPKEWENLPSLALPDGVHNVDQDTVYFLLPSLTNPNQSVYCVSCYRQVQSNELIRKGDDVTRSSVQKSVCVISTLPVFGYIKLKLELITQAYFKERDFAKVEVLAEMYVSLTEVITSDVLTTNALFEMINYGLAEAFHPTFPNVPKDRRKKQSANQSNGAPSKSSAVTAAPPTEAKGIADDDLLSEIEAALHSEKPVVNSMEKEEVKRQNKSANDNNQDDDEAQSPTSPTQRLFSVSMDRISEFSNKLTNYWEGNEGIPIEKSEEADDSALLRPSKLKKDAHGFPLSIFGKDSICQPYVSLPYIDLLKSIEPVRRKGKAGEGEGGDEDDDDEVKEAQEEYIPPRPIVDNIDDETAEIHSCIFGATNALFVQQRACLDVIIKVSKREEDDTETIYLDFIDGDTKRQCSLSTADLRFMEFITNAASSQLDDDAGNGGRFAGYEGNDEWIRVQFRGYLLSLISSVVAQDSPTIMASSQTSSVGNKEEENDPGTTVTTTSAEGNNDQQQMSVSQTAATATTTGSSLQHVNPRDFNTHFIQAWKETQNYKILCSHPAALRNIQEMTLPGHPFAGHFTASDVKTKLRDYMGTREGKRVTKAVGEAGKLATDAGRSIGQYFKSNWFTATSATSFLSSSSSNNKNLDDRFEPVVPGEDATEMKLTKSELTSDKKSNGAPSKSSAVTAAPPTEAKGIADDDLLSEIEAALHSEKPVVNSMEKEEVKRQNKSANDNNQDDDEAQSPTSPTQRLFSVSMDRISEFSNKLTNYWEGNEGIPIEKSEEADDSALLRPSKLKKDAHGFPLSIFGKDSICQPYVSLPYIDLLKSIEPVRRKGKAGEGEGGDEDDDDEVKEAQEEYIPPRPIVDNIDDETAEIHSCIFGATNALFVQQRACLDVIIKVSKREEDDTETIYLDFIDGDTKRQCSLSTADLRFMEFITNAASSQLDDDAGNGGRFAGYEGNDEWIRVQFRGYLLSLISSVVAQDSPTIMASSQTSSVGNKEEENDPGTTVTTTSAEGNNDQQQMSVSQTAATATTTGSSLQHVNPRDFNTHFIQAWKETQNYKILCSHPAALRNIQEMTLPGHPFAGHFTASDVKTKLRDYMGTREGKRVTKAVGEAGKLATDAGRSIGQYFKSNWFTATSATSFLSSSSSNNKNLDDRFEPVVPGEDATEMKLTKNPLTCFLFGEQLQIAHDSEIMIGA